MSHFAGAIAEAQSLLARDDHRINPLCRSRLHSHGHRTERAAVLFHGITNCPQQFERLGEVLFERGYNVLIPRYPHHGLADRLTRDQERLTEAELKTFGIDAARIGRGLGEHLTVCGLSLGGVLACWLAQVEPVDLAVAISPLFAMRRVPAALTGPITVAARVLPNLYIWWDPHQKAALKPAYGYPRFATHAFAAMLGLGREVQWQARRYPPRAGTLITITNANDPGVNNAATMRLVASWRKRWQEPVLTYQFPARLGLPHDLIDPGNPEQKVELVYPVLLKLLSSPATATSDPS